MGTAHFLEHMLFMGSEKYPSENEYSVFIKDNGGMSNAFTSLTDTNYHFDVSIDAFEEALDRMSQFFLAPAFAESSTEKEMNAVDAEYKQSMQSDAWRTFSLIQENSNPKSLLNRFNCGSLETLQVPGIRDELLAFHKRWYSSNLMSLVLTSNHPLDKLEEWAQKYFGGIENKNIEVPNLVEEPPFTDNEKGMFIRYVPVQDKDELSISWILPYTGEDHDTKPVQYHSHLFGHEGPNSLLSYLKKEDLATELGAGVDHELFGFTSFDISITLTKKGLKEYKQVLEAVFKYA